MKGWRTGWLMALCAWTLSSWGQDSFTLTGSVSDTRGQMLPGAAVLVEEDIRLGVTTDAQGRYTIVFPTQGPWTVRASFVGHSSETATLSFRGSSMQKRFRLTPGTSLNEAEVIGDGPTDVTVQKIDPRLANKIATHAAPLKMPCCKRLSISPRTEQRIQRARWSFDENLVYVNDIEVYRPFWFVQDSKKASPSPTDMVDRIEFSAGGFEAKYGDKLSSVLDITYRKPTGPATRVSASALGPSAT